MLNTLLDKLVAGILALFVWILPRLLRSPSGTHNPRVAHLRGALGYHLHSYMVALPNVQRWLRERGELFPTVLQVQTINRCNASCAMCPYPYTIHLQPRQVMDDALFAKIATECAQEPTLRDFVPMAKNEPLLDPKLEARIAFFKAQAAPHQMVELVTNGSALTPQRFARLVASGVDLLTISLNAATESTYREVMGGLSWTQIMRNLAAIQQSDTRQINIFLRFVKQRANAAEYRAFVQRWRKAGFNLMTFEINNRAGTVQGYGQLTTVKHRFEQWLRKRIGRLLFPACPYAFSLMHVLENGDVPFCANDWQNRLILGNVRDQSLRTIFNSPQLQALRELMRQGRYDEIAPCRDCSFRQEWLP